MSAIRKERPEVNTLDIKNKECSCSCCHEINREVDELLNKKPAANTTTSDTFRIEGMDCADCATKLEKKIKALDGVQAATVNFGAGKLTVEYSLTDDAIIKAIEQAGYQAYKDGLNRRSEVSTIPWWRKPKTLATILSGSFLLPAIILEWGGANEEILVPLYMAAMLLGGYHVAKSGLYGLKSFTMDTNFLMTIAAVGAVAIREWGEGAMVVFLFSLGNALQALYAG